MKNRWLELVRAENSEKSWFDWHGAEFSLRAWWETNEGQKTVMVLIKEKCPLVPYLVGESHLGQGSQPAGDPWLLVVFRYQKKLQKGRKQTKPDLAARLNISPHF